MFGLAFVGLGLVLVTFAVVMAVRTRKFLGKAVAGFGTVTGFAQRQQRDDDGVRTVYAPLIQFRTSDGRMSTFESNVTSGRPTYQVGATLPILYSPANLNEARIQSWFSLWGASTIFGGVGAVFSLFGVVFLLAQ